jgi:hypothetical protein
MVCTDLYLFISLISDDEYEKNILAFEKSLNVFCFVIIFQLSLSLLIKIVETMDKKT